MSNDHLCFALSALTDNVPLFLEVWDEWLQKFNLDANSKFKDRGNVRTLGSLIINNLELLNKFLYDKKFSKYNFRVKFEYLQIAIKESFDILVEHIFRKKVKLQVRNFYSEIKRDALIRILDSLNFISDDVRLNEQDFAIFILKAVPAHLMTKVRPFFPKYTSMNYTSMNYTSMNHTGSGRFRPLLLSAPEYLVEIALDFGYMVSYAELSMMTPIQKKIVYKCYLKSAMNKQFALEDETLICGQVSINFW